MYASENFRFGKVQNRQGLDAAGVVEILRHGFRVRQGEE
jgi:hypothetical protein